MADDEDKKKISWKKIVLIGIVVILIVLIGWLYISGNLGFLLTKVGVVFSDNPALAKLGSGISKAFNFIINPAEAISESASWKNPVVEEVETKNYVEFRTFKPEKVRYQPGEDIGLRGSIGLEGLEEKDFEAVVSCDLGETEVKAQVLGLDDNEIRVPKGSTRIYQTKCNFAGKELVYAENVKSVVGKLNVLYKGFTTNGGLTIYTIGPDEYEEISAQGKNPLKEYQIESEYLTSDDTTISWIEEGPLSVSMVVEATQPLVEGRTYALGVALKENVGWRGKLENLRELKIKLPDNFEVIPENCKSFSVTSNNFLVLGESTNTEGYRLIKQQITSKESLKDLELWCEFRLEETGESLTSDFLKLLVDYDYKFSKQTSVNIFA